MCLKYLCDLEMAFSVIAGRAHGVMFGCHFPTVLLLSLGIVAGDGDGEGGGLKGHTVVGVGENCNPPKPHCMIRL